MNAKAAKSDALVPKKAVVVPAEELPRDDPASPRVGRWYWVGISKKRNKKSKKTRGFSRDDDAWLGCVTSLGTNYVELEGPDGRNSSNTARVHVDEFWDTCEHVPDPDRVIGERIARHQAEVERLMGEVKDVTARLAIAPGPALTTGGSETRALALRGTGQDVGKYKKALVKAKDKELPALFEEIREHNDQLAVWLSASLIPLKAQAGALEPAIERIEERIFSVELYAGLVEEVVEIKGGEPAALQDKIHLFQRKAFMDEECLAQYETGGMEFKNIRAFDKWLARRDNFERLLPFPRTVLALQVRRKEKEREWENLKQLIRIFEEKNLDKLTFLYLRNGEQLFRLSTEVEWGEQLFPDTERSAIFASGGSRGKLWAKMSGSRVETIVTDDEFQAIVQKEKEEAARIAALPEKERHWHHHWPDSNCYEPFARESVHYDDIAKHIQGEMDKHNRLVLVLQGLLDRSPVFHPHPPWQLWDGGGFVQALALVHDGTRALVAGDAPDFCAYQKSLNDKLEPGSITVGQEDYWERVEAARESRRMDSNWRTSSRDWRPSKHRPEGDPGPGKVARITRVMRSKKSGLVATFAWARSKRQDGWRNEGKNKIIPCSIVVPASRLLNVSAYKPGDFKLFYSDPRTRADYLEWAPMLLEAEEYHAGNREVREPEKLPKHEPSREGQYRYQKMKRRQAFIGKAVRLKWAVYTGSGIKYEKGSLWRAGKPYRGKFTITGIDEQGRELRKKDGCCERYVGGIDMTNLEIDASIPDEPKDDG